MSAGERSRIRIGTSGWHYQHWKGPFYPRQLEPSSFFSFYRRFFDSVEINNTFYRLPAASTLLDWREEAGHDFLFSVKASRYITHMKKLKDGGGPARRFLDRIDSLSETLGPVLFQLPPRWRLNVGRLSDFLKALPDGYRYAFEFRDASWFGSEVKEILVKAGAAFCIFDLNGRLSPRWVTADFVYVRLHGPGGPYRGSYSHRELQTWSERLSRWSSQGKTVYLYFDNDEAGFAALNALDLKAML